MPVRIGTRGSRLALAQAEKVCSLLLDHGIEAEEVIISTQGDTVTGVPLHEIGGQGVFVRALDDAILAGEIDAAVHSMKDIPAKRPDGLVTSAILKRDSPSDFIAHTVPLDSVSVIGTSSTRRKAQLLRHDPSLEIRPLRGNVDTRLRKLDEGQFDAIILAEAGMQRMGLKISGERLPPHIFVPAPNQGTIAVVSRDDPALNETFSLLDHEQTRNDVMAERAVMEEVGGGCFTPQGIYCSGGYLIAEVLSLDGTRCVRVEDDIKTPDDARRCGMKLHNDAKELIDEAYRALGIEDER